MNRLSFSTRIHPFSSRSSFPFSNGEARQKCSIWLGLTVKKKKLIFAAEKRNDRAIQSNDESSINFPGIEANEFRG